MIALLLPVLLIGSDAERTVVIGDSQAEGLKNARVLTRAGVSIHAFGGKPTGFFLHWLAAHPRAVKDKECVVFQVGGNDISAGESVETIQENITALATLTRSLNPDALVVFGAIPVRGQWFDAQKRKNKPLIVERETTLERVNAWLRHEGAHPTFASFAFNDIIADSDSPRLQRLEFKRRTADVHLNRKGYAAVAQGLLGTLINP